MMMSHEELVRRAKQLGVPIDATAYRPTDKAVVPLPVGDYELHRRIKEEERHRREHMLWIVAVAAAIFAGLAAMAAWWPVFNSFRFE
jgi:hypothetical protein